MAQLTVTNLSGRQFFLADIYKTLEIGEVVTFDRASVDIPNMRALIEGVAASELSLAVVYDAEELASGLMQPPWSVEAQDMAPVAATTPASGLVTIRQAFVAGGGAPGADDVTIYAANALPYKLRVLSAMAYIVTAVALSTIEVRSRAGGLGTLAASLSSAATGRVDGTVPANATVALSPGATEGLFLRRSDKAVVGEVILTCRLES
jgi:hypothetical protein